MRIFREFCGKYVDGPIAQVFEGTHPMTARKGLSRLPSTEAALTPVRAGGTGLAGGAA